MHGAMRQEQITIRRSIALVEEAPGVNDSLRWPCGSGCEKYEAGASGRYGHLLVNIDCEVRGGFDG